MLRVQTPLDATAITLSALCLIHCLALPVLSLSLPVLGALAEAEWIHQVLVILALPIPVIAVLNDRGQSGRYEFTVLAAVSLSLMLAAAFFEPLHDFETALTIVGSTLLAAAHIRRWIWRRAARLARDRALEDQPSCPALPLAPGVGSLPSTCRWSAMHFPPSSRSAGRGSSWLLPSRSIPFSG